MIFFNELLAKADLTRHDNRPLWKYHMEENEFQKLKEHLKSCNSLKQVDYKDASLYYAEWWKRDYNGGKPSKQEIYNSINNARFTPDELYRHAKTGADRLQIKWIKKLNSLFFRSLLLQGGLPIKHLKNNKSNYTEFLLKILELNPQSVEDFQYDSNITKLLPESSQNETIYDSCFEIIKAILNDEEGFLSILDNDENLKSISNQLRINKKKSNYSKKVSIKPLWILKIKDDGRSSINFRLNIPESISDDEFKSIFDFDDFLDYEYKLIINDILFCKFIKKINGGFKTVFFLKQLTWDESDLLPEVFIINTGGQKIGNSRLINFAPNLEAPSLWTQFTDNEWILNRSRNTEQEFALILFNNEYQFTETLEARSERNTTIGLINLKALIFKGHIQMTSSSHTISFNTSHQRFEWFILDEKPSWIYKANMPVVRGIPKVFLYDEQGNALKAPEIFFRKFDTLNWEKLTSNASIPKGYLQLKFVLNNCEEIDNIFNIGNLTIDAKSEEFNNGSFKINNSEFLFKINEGKDYSIEKIDNNGFIVRLLKNENIPKVINAHIKFQHQRKGLSFQLLPTFKGVEVLDNKNEILKNDSIILLHKINGLRIMSNDENIILKMFNNKRPNIVKIKPLEKSNYSFNLLKDNIADLLMLSDDLDKEGFIIIQICRENVVTGHQSFLKSYKVLHYSGLIENMFDNQILKIKTENHLIQSLFAVPLDCKLNEIEIIALDKFDEHFEIPTTVSSEKFIIFSSYDEINGKLLPAYTTTIANSPLTDYNDKLERIEAFKNELLKTYSYESEIWNKFLTYFNLCTEQNLAYSNFDILRSISHSSALAAKAFVFLSCFGNIPSEKNYSYDDVSGFSFDIIKKLEDEIGFSFHWINKNHWFDAVDWVCPPQDFELFEIVMGKLNGYFDYLHPNEQFQKIKLFLQSEPIQNPNVSINQEILSLRESLNSRVKNELPQKYPIISDKYKTLIPTNESNQPVKALIRIPVAVALSIAGKESSIWNKDGEFIRRNIKYSQDIHPEWYSKAICYCLGKLAKQETNL